MDQMDGQYVNEELYKKMKKRYLAAGISMLVIGGILAIVGLVLNISGSVSSQFDDPKALIGMAIMFVGVVILMPGLMLTIKANQRAIAAYQAASVAPVKSDTINYVGQNVTPTVEKVSEAVAKGINNATNQNFCSECGKKIPKDAKFCPFCGKKLD